MHKIQAMGISEKDLIVKKRKSLSVFIFIFLYFLMLFFVSCNSPKESLYKESRNAMYTIVSITVSSDSEKKSKEAIDKAFNELNRLERLLNFYSEDSEISMINKYAGERPVKVSQDTFDIIQKAIYVSEQTEGMFDITVGPLVRVWDFQNALIPEDQIIKDRTKLIGYKNIILDKERSTVFLKKKGIEIDLGGIIKGYAADKAVDVLKKNGIKSGIVAVAGDIKTFGMRPDNKPWRVGIQNPREKGYNDEIIAVIDISDLAISTSGDYQKYFIKDGKRYHHLLNPRTGHPVNDFQSVTIITDDAALADAFATGIFILGQEKGINLLKRLGLDGIIINIDGKIITTDGIKDKIKFIKEQNR